MRSPVQTSFLVLAGTLLGLLAATGGQASHQRTFLSIPILGVIEQGGKVRGTTTYLAVQFDRLPESSGPQMQFNEGSRVFGPLKGTALSADWKDSAWTAINAAAKVTDNDPRTWLITLKNVSTAYLADGPSGSAALAVAIVAALRHVSLLSNMALTGAIERDGRISAVGGIPEKLQGAAAAGISTVLIPAGQSRTRDWDAGQISESLRITVVEVRTLGEAYEKMTGQTF